MITRKEACCTILVGNKGACDLCRAFDDLTRECCYPSSTCEEQLIETILSIAKQDILGEPFVREMINQKREVKEIYG